MERCSIVLICKQLCFVLILELNDEYILLLELETDVNDFKLLAVLKISEKFKLLVDLKILETNFASIYRLNPLELSEISSWLLNLRSAMVVFI